MTKNIIILTDYKNNFGTKYISPVYRGGLDLSKVLSIFEKHGYNAKTVQISELNINDVIHNKPVILYNSSEDNFGFYKSFVEDVIHHLELRGSCVIPPYQFLRAHNNKVSMELLRDRSDITGINTIKTKVFGTFEELKKASDSFTFPVVIKAASGAMSKGVEKAENATELIIKARKISRSSNIRHDLKEKLRKLKYGNKYQRESFFRSKFVVQNLIPNLENDWKVLVYGQKCFALYRGNRKNDFRASGSGNFVFKKDLPEGMLEYAYSIQEYYNVPHISLDIGFDGKNFHLIEFQFINFGTSTLEKSPFYFEKTNNGWQLNEGASDIEDVYVSSIVNYLNEKYKT